jgi:hypothetical protein
MPPESILKFIEQYEWTFAKSMPKTPHWYVVREKCIDAEFVEFAEYIRKFGVPRRFFRTSYTYYDLGEYTYWTMGNPIEITRIINRALIV